MQGKIVCADMTKRKKGETLEDMAEFLLGRLPELPPEL